MSNLKARIIPYYLPQFHPILQNDEWWGKGFTEWTNVAKAKPLFKGHYQPRLPADLGFYDLRVPEVREHQAQMAIDYGIEGFCYYHYWFGDGKQILERPLNEVLETGKPDFPFCLCWANESWKGIWFGETNRLLIEQKYPGKEDYEEHFEYLLKAFSDDRYIKVDEKPLFQILTPSNLPNCLKVTDMFRELAHKKGLKGLFIVAGYRCDENWNPLENGFDAIVSGKFKNALNHKLPFINSLTNRILNSRYFVNNLKAQRLFKKYYQVCNYKNVVEFLNINKDYDYDYYPCVIPNWDNTARSGLKGYIMTNTTPALFKEHIDNAVEYVQRYEPDHRIVFIKSWNEWAEGNYLEPDNQHGLKYLEAVRDSIL